MSIWLADVNGKIVKAIVDRNFKKFLLKVSNIKYLINSEFNLDIESIVVCDTFLSCQFGPRLLQ